MPNEWKRKSLDELVEACEAGLHGQGAFAEIHRRTARNTTWLMIITILLAGVAAFFTAATVFPEFAVWVRDLFGLP